MEVKIGQTCAFSLPKSTPPLVVTNISNACTPSNLNFNAKDSMETKSWVVLPNQVLTWVSIFISHITVTSFQSHQRRRMSRPSQWVINCRQKSEPGPIEIDLPIIGEVVSLPRTPLWISHLKPFPLNCRLKNELSIRMELISLNRRLRPSFYVLISCAITPSSLRRLTAHADPIQTRIAGPYWKALCTGLLLNWILSGARACKW